MGLRSRFYAETASAIALSGLSFLTLVCPDWIEAAFNVNPDQGHGGLELTIVAAVGATAAGCARLAWREWLRVRTSTAAR